MKTYKYLSDAIVAVIDEDGLSRTSGLASALVPEGAEILPADPVPNPRIDQIKQELAALDARKIRPLAEGDTAYLATLNSQTVALRTELGALA